MTVASSAILFTNLWTWLPYGDFNVLIEFLDPQNLYVDTKTIILARILKKISGILCFGTIFTAILCNWYVWNKIRYAKSITRPKTYV